MRLGEAERAPRPPPAPRSVLSTWELYVDTRFEQLRAACDLELWAEAFRSVEDIQGLAALAPKGIKGPKPVLMATYYAKLTQIFTRSENRLYNAYAWYRCGRRLGQRGRQGRTERTVCGTARARWCCACRRRLGRLCLLQAVHLLTPEQQGADPG